MIGTAMLLIPFMHIFNYFKQEYIEIIGTIYKCIIKNLEDRYDENEFEKNIISSFVQLFCC